MRTATRKAFPVLSFRSLRPAYDVLRLNFGDMTNARVKLNRVTPFAPTWIARLVLVNRGHALADDKFPWDPEEIRYFVKSNQSKIRIKNFGIMF